jgi:hypothetical protein
MCHSTKIVDGVEVYDYKSDAKIVYRTTRWSEAEQTALASADDVTNMYLAKKTYSDTVQSYQSSISQVRKYLTECIQNDGIDTDVANEIAELLGIELSTTYDIEFVVRYTATVSVPLGEEAPSEYDFEVRIDYNGDGNLESEDYTTEDFDCEEDC